MTSIQDLQEQIASLQAQLAEARAQLDHHALLYRSMFETVPVGVVVTDADGQIFYGNSAVERMTGHPAGATGPSEHYTDPVFFHADGRRVQAHEYPLARVIEQREPHSELDVQYERNDGSRFWMKVVAEPILDEQGTVMGGAVACVDIDKEFSLFAEKNEMIRELNHRVRNTFSVLNAIVNRSMRGGGCDDATREKVTRRLATYAEAYERTIRAPLEPVDLKALAADLMASAGDQPVTLEGERVGLPPRYAVPVSLALAELAGTTAAQDDASARLSWTVRPSATGRSALVIRWEHQGCDGEAAQSLDPFAAFVTGSGLSAETGARVETNRHSGGWTWQADIPLPS